MKRLILSLCLGISAALLGQGIAQADSNPIVEIVTNLGTITVELDSRNAPLSTNNFLKYVDKKAYDGTIFHRVIPNFMIQGGGFTPDMQEKPADLPITNEGRNGLKNLRGTIAMARTEDPNSATNQFYLNLADNPPLDADPISGSPGYAVFGKVIKGLEVMDKIAHVPTNTVGQNENVPVSPVTILSVRRG